MFLRYFFSKFVLGLKNLKTVSKRTRNVIFFVLYVYITLVYCPYLDNICNDGLESDPLFLMYWTLFGLSFNFLNSYITKDWRFLAPLPNIKTIFSTLIYQISKASVVLKKFYFFLKNEVFFILISVLKKTFSKITSLIILWNPLFKKTSYLSFYKSFGARFLKNKKFF